MIKKIKMRDRSVLADVQANVYWLYDSFCRSPLTDGYVGMTINLSQRIRAHRSLKNFPKRFNVKILFTGTRRRCLLREKKLRPHPNMGWNIFSGGEIGNKWPIEKIKQRVKKFTGFRHDPKIIADMIGNRNGIGNKSMTGKKASRKTRQLMSSSQLRRRRRERKERKK